MSHTATEFSKETLVVAFGVTQIKEAWRNRPLIEPPDKNESMRSTVECTITHHRNKYNRNRANTCSPKPNPSVSKKQNGGGKCMVRITEYTRVCVRNTDLLRIRRGTS